MAAPNCSPCSNSVWGLGQYRLPVSLSVRICPLKGSGMGRGQGGTTGLQGTRRQRAAAGRCCRGGVQDDGVQPSRAFAGRRQEARPAAGRRGGAHWSARSHAAPAHPLASRAAGAASRPPAPQRALWRGRQRRPRPGAARPAGCGSRPTRLSDSYVESSLPAHTPRAPGANVLTTWKIAPPPELNQCSACLHTMGTYLKRGDRAGSSDSNCIHTCSGALVRRGAPRPPASRAAAASRPPAPQWVHCWWLETVLVRASRVSGA